MPLSLSLPKNLAIRTFGELLKVFSTKINLLYLLYSTARSFCVLHIIKKNYLLKTFLRTLILITRASLFCNSHMFKMVITSLDSSNASGRDCILVVVLKKLWAWTFLLTSWTLQLNKSVWRSLVFQIVGRFQRWSLYLKMFWKSLKITALLVFFLWLVFAKLVNNTIVDHLEKYELFSDIQYGFRSSWSTTDLLTIVSDRVLGLLGGLGLLEL